MCEDVIVQGSWRVVIQHTCYTAVYVTRMLMSMVTVNSAGGGGGGGEGGRGGGGEL